MKKKLEEKLGKAKKSPKKPIAKRALKRAK